MESADFGNFSVTAVRVDGSVAATVARLSRQWISEIKLDSIRRNSADPCVRLENESLFIGIVFGVEVPAFTLIFVLILLQFMSLSFLKYIIDPGIDTQYLLPKDSSISIHLYRHVLFLIRCLELLTF